MMLTGESLHASKNANTTSKPDTGPGDRLNRVFSNTTITEGRGSGVVVATGMSTEIGEIASALNGSSSDSGRKGTWYVCIGANVGKFLGLTVGTPLRKKLSELFMAFRDRSHPRNCCAGGQQVRFEEECHHLCNHNSGRNYTSQPLVGLNGDHGSWD